MSNTVAGVFLLVGFGFVVAGMLLASKSKKPRTWYELNRRPPSILDEISSFLLVIGYTFVLVALANAAVNI